ncbi:Wadjet anti-phage system protein JetD domain-containing protein [Paenibacillus hexagrammi]|uniref:DUF2220 domain-containing protein n=1 Tax=Paenibacillus hexagrammi TaxID=2908839 RepID=A0ABY3SM96_9BACL|nr:Wadjet anti-phage system protein JetD domain-containing protein [Paenibacillus sp. YPD9-1]UJF34655.1 DUF2220 domain-containing protein [Paenibacillus sp. YPD9-1]
MNPKPKIIHFLQSYKKAKISLTELEALFPGNACSYDQFAGAVLELEADGILEIMKSKGRTGRQPSLAYQYKLARSVLMQDVREQVHRARLHMHEAISLDAYYSLDAAEWLQDLPYLQQIDDYLKRHGLPSTTVPAPERSYELVRNEKWISEGQGKELLERIKIWDKLRIVPAADPLMMAVNPRSLANAHHLHFIVENKTTYQALLQELPFMPFSTLIYGCGKKIIKSIELLPMQLPLDCASGHHFYYFGDVDREGLNIWYALDQRVRQLYDVPLQPALPFMKHSCINHTPRARSISGRTKRR